MVGDDWQIEFNRAWWRRMCERAGLDTGGTTVTATAEPTYEHHFKTLDKRPGPNGDVDVTFDLIEDESGDVWWGYGHVDPGDFIDEVNRWLEHCGLTGDDFFVRADHRVDHLWARYVCDDHERFELVKDYGNDLLKKHADVFPVTRLWV